MIISMTKLVCIYILFFLFFSCSSFCQTKEESPLPSTFITSVPFIQLTGGIIILKGVLADFSDTLNFILDTGSSGISLDSSLAESFGLRPQATNLIIKGIGGDRKVTYLYNKTIHLGSHTIDSLNFHINDYYFLSLVYGMPIDGVIGYSLFSRYIVKVDYDKQVLELYSQGKIKYPNRGYMLRPEISTLPFIKAELGDDRIVKSRFLFDIGADLCILLSNKFFQDSMRMNKKRKFFSKEGEGLGGKLDMKVTVMKQIKVGPYKFKNIPTLVFFDTNNITSYPFLGGILGNDIFRRFNLIINYQSNEIFLSPNKHYSEPFDYSYIGTEIYAVSGQIEVGSIYKDSPADKAGLKEGDIILGINNNFMQNIIVYKNLLQEVNNRLIITVRRSGEILQFKLKVGSIR